MAVKQFQLTTIAAGTAVLLTSFGGHAVAQSAPVTPKKAEPTAQPMDAPAAQPIEAPTAQPIEAPTAQPIEAPAAAPKLDTMPTTPMAPTTLPDTTPVAPAESMPMPKTQPSELPKLESIPTSPAEPRVSTTSNPASVTGAAVTTMILPKETITGVKSVSLPEPLPVQAAYFTLPIDVRVVKDSNIASSTPISDKYTDKASWDVKAWAAAVSSCLQAKPKLVRMVGSEQVPFMLNGTEGTIMLNSSDKAVCPM